MTRGFLIKMTKEFLGEIPLSPGDASPMLYDILITAGCDELAKKTDCWWGSATFNIVAGQADYCADEADPASRSDIYKLRAVTWYDSDGEAHNLQQVDVQYLDKQFCGWRNQANGSPRYCIYKGLNRITLYPTPDTTQSAAVRIEGYAKPYQSWPLSTDECPLPGGDDVHMGIAYYVAAKRAITFNKDPELAQAMQAEYVRIKGELEKTAIENNESLRFADIRSRNVYGFGYGY